MWARSDTRGLRFDDATTEGFQFEGVEPCPSAVVELPSKHEDDVLQVVVVHLLDLQDPTVLGPPEIRGQGVLPLWSLVAPETSDICSHRWSVGTSRSRLDITTSDDSQFIFPVRGWSPMPMPYPNEDGVISLNCNHLAQGVFGTSSSQVLRGGQNPLGGGVGVLHPHQLPSLKGHLVTCMTSSVSLRRTVWVTSSLISVLASPGPRTTPFTCIGPHVTTQ